MKTSLLVLFVLSMLFLGCKKEEVIVHSQPYEICGTPYFDYSNYVGDFLVDIESTSAYIYGSTSSSDHVISITASWDTIRLTPNGVPFLMTSDTQTVFTYAFVTEFEDVTASLVFTNDFQDIEYSRHSTSLAFGPNNTTQYTGSRTALLPTIDPHPYSNEIVGDYRMTVTKKDVWTGLDTTYVDTLSVTMISGTLANVENLNFSVYAHSYRNVQTTDGNTEFVTSDKWYRTTDSLYVENLTYSGIWSTQQDSVQSKYYGVKL